eukprot:CAMPEP_0197289156 /NCGR_PEP_ID=MMETSP0890-20130614/6362_1 /TAXON_ID=44058 ORGANISM="Aureoumbra lagunensis, Strain CCMP1510" /NCGR_SAMPLE_ID=MMETSP0890 /ASSEMBLY_ACC=CAM_ASM_000533 /LENGTH=380 /DNA_ID=CAMNT_0042760355 /DNA_START=1 /DNA_END=1143 /DNA_ORIENTATION=+
MIDGAFGVYDTKSKSCRGCKANKGSGSCRVVDWAGWTENIVAGYESGQIRIWDCTKMKGTWKNKVGGSVCCSLGLQENVFAIGDDQGCISVWDVRSAPTLGGSLQVHEDYVSDLTKASNLLLASGADGRLSILEPRKNLKRIAQSDPQDDELFCLQVMKQGKKVVCGTQTGALVIWSWDRWGDSSDRAIGHPESVDTMLKIDEDTLCTGSSDGIIRLVKIFPSLKILANLDNHSAFPIERLAHNADSSVIASISHDTIVRFFCLDDIQSSDHDNDENEMSSSESADSQDDDDPQIAKASAAMAKKKANKNEYSTASFRPLHISPSVNHSNDDDDGAFVSTSSAAKIIKRPLPSSFTSKKGEMKKKKRGVIGDSDFFDGFL